MLSVPLILMVSGLTALPYSPTSFEYVNSQGVSEVLLEILPVGCLRILRYLIEAYSFDVISATDLEKTVSTNSLTASLSGVVRYEAGNRGLFVFAPISILSNCLKSIGINKVKTAIIIMVATKPESAGLRLTVLGLSVVLLVSPI